MKIFDHLVTDRESGTTRSLRFVQFYNGTVWTLDRYLRLLARQQFRRAVVNKHYCLLNPFITREIKHNTVNGVVQTETSPEGWLVNVGVKTSTDPDLFWHFPTFESAVLFYRLFKIDGREIHSAKKLALGGWR